MDPEASLSSQEKDVEEDSGRLDIKKRKNKKQYKTNTETELELFLKRYSHFQLRSKICVSHLLSLFLRNML